MTTAKVLEFSPKEYKKWLLECLPLRQQGGKSAFKRASLLNKVFLDRDFRLENNAVDDFGLAKILDAYVEDLALRFLELRAMLEQFPKESQWGEGKLRTMYDEVVAKSGEVQEREVRPRHKISLAQYAALEEKYHREQTRCKQLQQKVDELETELKEAQTRLRKLERPARGAA